MRSYLKSCLSRRLSCLSLSAAAYFGASLPLAAQHRLMTPSPFDPVEHLEVLGLDESQCLVDLGFGVDRLVASCYFFEPAASYADGYLEINRPVGRILQEKRKAKFDFSVKVKASRDYENCFVVLQLYTQDGREYLLPYEVADLKAGETRTVSIDPELAYNDLNRGVYYYHFFSGGDEIYYAPTRFQLGKSNQRPLALKDSGDREPEVEQLPVAPLPENLIALLSGEEALVALGVNDSGYSVDHLLLSASNSSVGQMAINLVKNARFKPGSEEGFYARKDLLLRVRFDARGQYRFLVE